MEGFAGVRSFLRHYAPLDVLMPVRRGQNQPMFMHQGRSWTWRKLDEYLRRGGAGGADEPPVDACVLLQDLCVVDVDTLARADELERRFPVLRAAPTGGTARGRHYWFLRSDECDRDGFYDGPGQVQRGVDFKTRCATGTCGVVVVAPLGAAALVSIPSDLQAAVAAPRHRGRERLQVFEFDGGERAELSVRRPETMSYFEPMREGDVGVGEGDAWRVPCGRREFEDLLALIDGERRCLPRAGATAATPARALVALADKLGCDSVRRLVLDGHELWRHDLHRGWPDMSDAMAADATAAGARDAAGDRTRDVDASAPIAHVPHPTCLDTGDERWLFLRKGTTFREGDVVVPPGAARCVHHV
jgi:hypothetical protein